MVERVLEVLVVPSSGLKRWKWRVVERQKEIASGYETTRKDAQSEGDAMLFALLSLPQPWFSVSNASRRGGHFLERRHGHAASADAGNGRLAGCYCREGPSHWSTAYPAVVMMANVNVHKMTKLDKLWVLASE
jgi:hypothetical protein